MPPFASRPDTTLNEHFPFILVGGQPVLPCTRVQPRSGMPIPIFHHSTLIQLPNFYRSPFLIALVHICFPTNFFLLFHFISFYFITFHCLSILREKLYNWRTLLFQTHSLISRPEGKKNPVHFEFYLDLISWNNWKVVKIKISQEKKEQKFCCSLLCIISTAFFTFLSPKTVRKFCGKMESRISAVFLLFFYLVRV